MNAVYFMAVLLIKCTPLFSQEDVTYPEYEKILFKQLEHNTKCREKIAEEQSLISVYKKQISEIKKNTNKIRQKELEFLGITREDIEKIVALFEKYQKDSDTIYSLNDEEFSVHFSSIEMMQLKIDSIKNSPLSKLPQVKRKLNNLTSSLQKCFKRFSEVPPESTTVVSESFDRKEIKSDVYVVGKIKGNPETLFNISRKVYGDPHKWPLIYRANRDILDRNFNKFKKDRKNSAILNPSDLILPDQVLVIPR